MRYPAAILLLVLALGACSSRQGKSLKLVYADDRVQRGLKRIAFIRGLNAREPVEVREVEPEQFIKVIGARSNPDPLRNTRLAGELQAAGLLWTGGLTPDEEDAPRKTRELAFYQEIERVVYIDKSRTRLGSEVIEEVLAHELTHALQHQIFGFPDWKEIGTFDQSMAVKSLYEGDATMVGYMANAQRSGVSWSETLANLMGRARTGLVDVNLFYLDKNVSVDKVIQHCSYFRGSLFTYALYLEGGFSRVDGAYANPPASTEQVLHPDKYLKGEPPLRITLPEPPSGWRVTGGATVGELGVRVYLSRCFKWDPVVEMASGWGGDRLAVLENDQGGKALFWVIAWDDQDAANRFVAHVAPEPGCFLASLNFDPESGKFVIPVVHMMDTLVSVSLGLTNDIAESLLERTKKENPAQNDQTVE